jgi:hypothetical protein
MQCSDSDSAVIQRRMRRSSWLHAARHTTTHLAMLLVQCAHGGAHAGWRGVKQAAAVLWVCLRRVQQVWLRCSGGSVDHAATFRTCMTHYLLIKATLRSRQAAEQAYERKAALDLLCKLAQIKASAATTCTMFPHSPSLCHHSPNC